MAGKGLQHLDSSSDDHWITKVTSPLWHNLHMCGRYRLSRRKQIIEEYFDAPGDDDWAPRYNVAPTQPVPIIRQHPKEPKRVMSLVRWGLIPTWSKDASAAAKLINARSETAHILPAFKDALKFRRCLIPADGFYEWQKGGTRQPHCFEVRDGQLFAFAGLWERWKDPNGNWIKSCSILTTTPNTLTSKVHDRMPVILEPEKYDIWLDPGMQDTETVKDLLKPYDAALMRSYSISAYVNNVANDDAQCAMPVELEVSAQSQLFE